MVPTLGKTLALNCCTMFLVLAALDEAIKVTRVPTLMPEAPAKVRRHRSTMAVADWSAGST